ncbi:hypothetical protein COV11_03060 [Candidatus Woesearchaeota archaeon CG10_big_fil_rev_8_21_14_0_10_30_7]|nr:MAG: hypothetical protein COV11_03060 [Candidatus Woesearchaeota archaeon CG10_big_fil_rev_8_21_14_0_10_30_7]
MVKNIIIDLSVSGGSKDSKLSEVQLSVDGSKLIFSGVPDNDGLEYVARNDFGEYFIVHRPKEDWGYDDFRLHVGMPNKLVETKVGCVRRLRDGGTTHISYTLNDKIGHLYFPSRFKTEEKPSNTYDGKSSTLENLATR